MYYYEVEDVNGTVIRNPATPYNYTTDALSAAKDDLASSYVTGYPVEIKVYAGPPEDPERWVTSTYYVSEEDIKQHALKRIEEANREELQKVIRQALDNHARHKGQWEQGLLTPAEFAAQEALNWTDAQYEIDRIKNQAWGG